MVVTAALRLTCVRACIPSKYKSDFLAVPDDECYGCSDRCYQRVSLSAMAAQAIQHVPNVYLKYQRQLMAEGVVTEEQVKRISGNVQAALQARLLPRASMPACLSLGSAHLFALVGRPMCSMCIAIHMLHCKDPGKACH